MRLGDACGFCNAGLEMLGVAARDLVKDLVKDLVAKGNHVLLLDLRLSENPNSAAGAVRAAGAPGAPMVTPGMMLPGEGRSSTPAPPRHAVCGRSRSGATTVR